MSRVLALVPVSLLAVVFPLSAGQKSKEPDRPPAHVLLQEELRQEQQALQRMQTEWLLQLLKLKQRLAREGTAASKEEAAACTRLLAGFRELPALYDDAVVRLKQPSFASLPVLKDALKATGNLADGLRRAQEVLSKAPPAAFAAERALGATDGVHAFALFEAANDVSAAVRLMEEYDKTMAPTTGESAMKLFTRSRSTCLAALTAFQTAANNLPEEKRPEVLREKVVAPLKQVLENSGPFAQADASLRALSEPKGNTAQAISTACKDMRDLRAALEPLAEGMTRLVVVGGLQELVDRQQRLHDRLKKHYDQSIANLLSDLEK